VQGAGAIDAASSLQTQIDTRAKAVEAQLIAWRRDVYQHPKLGNEPASCRQVPAHVK
jgi:metal-dependent amidase/aminoacylase/carboxypeptidase family protein